MTCKHGWFRDEDCPMCAQDSEHFGYNVEPTPSEFPSWFTILLAIVVGLLLVAVVSDEFLAVWRDAPPVLQGSWWSAKP